MCKAITTSELKKLLASIVDKQDQQARELEGETNPQLVQSRIVSETRAELAFDVLKALRGDSVTLRIMAE